ncbi:hypothetical protein CYL17_18190 [Thermobispora bispora]|nr:hypothetical protein CYL17_18190 [Thermobispora bispora]
MVDRLGEQRGEQPLRRPGVGRRPGERPAVGGERAEPGDPELLGLPQGEPGVPLPQRRPEPRPLPGEPGEHGLLLGGEPRGGRGEHAEHLLPHPGGRGPAQLGVEGAERAVPLVPLAGQPGHPVRAEPGGGEHRPPVLGRPGPPSVVGPGRQPLALPGRDQPGGVGDLDDQGGEPLGQVEQVRGPPQIPYGEAARAQHPGRVGAPELAQLLHRAGEGERLPGGGPVDEGRVPPPADRLGRAAGQVAVVPVAADHQGDLARHHHGVVAHRGEQAAGEQLLHRRAGRRGAERAPGVRQPPHGGPPGEVGEHGPGLRRDLTGQPADRRRVGEQRHEPVPRLARSRAAGSRSAGSPGPGARGAAGPYRAAGNVRVTGNRVPGRARAPGRVPGCVPTARAGADRAQDRGDLLRMEQPHHLGGGRAEARGRLHRLGHPRRGEHGARRAVVEQGTGAEPVQGLVQGGAHRLRAGEAAGGAGQRGEQSVPGGAAAQEHERLQHRQGEAVEPVQGAGERGRGARAVGEGVEMGGDRADQFGARGDELAQPLIGCAAEPFPEFPRTVGVAGRVRARHPSIVWSFPGTIPSRE